LKEDLFGFIGSSGKRKLKVSGMDFIPTTGSIEFKERELRNMK
jgi:hypothetical protein